MKNRHKSMLKVDFRRMFTMPLFYIFAGACFAAPILILVMTTMMDGTVSVNPNTGAETVVEGFDNVWQIIGTVSGQSAPTAQAADAAMGGGMDMMSMCNINLLYLAAAVLISLFVSEDFKSGYSKNLFTIRAKKSDYVISKTLVGFVCVAIMIMMFFTGAMLGGAIVGLPFGLDGFGADNLVMCMLSKILLMAVFIGIYVLAAVAAKQRTWLSMIISLGAGMLLFMMIPALTPLNAGIFNVILTLACGAVFASGLGAVSAVVLSKTSLV